jgi:hypothetical protein
MRRNFVLILGVLLVFSFVCGGCRSVSGNVESALAFSQPIPINGLLIGSFSYNINDTYLASPDGSIFIAPPITKRNGHIAYEAKQATNGATYYALKEEYHIASYDELYLWAVRCAADKAGITNIIGIKSFIATTTRSALVANVTRQDVTVTVYGEAQ